MGFNSREALQNHQNKFCINSKYANLDSLTNHFEELTKGRDISMYGRPHVAKEGKVYNFNTN